jgi:tetrahedral aminopeptidase
LIKGNQFYPGAFHTKSIHLMEYGEEDYTEEFRELTIGCGAVDREMLEKNKINIGNPVFFEPQFKILMDTELCHGTNLDDRVGTFALFKMNKYFLTKPEERGDVYLVSTVSEEAEPQGSNLAARVLKKDIDIAIAIDATPSPDYFFGDPESIYAEYGTEINLSLGPAIKKGGFKEELISNTFKKIAKKNKINCQFGADAEICQTDELWFRMQGIPTSEIGIPMRNTHTRIETIDTCDLEKVIIIAKEFPYEISKDEVFKKYIKSIIRLD